MSEDGIITYGVFDRYMWSNDIWYRLEPVVWVAIATGIFICAFLWIRKFIAANERGGKHLKK